MIFLAQDHSMFFYPSYTNSVILSFTWCTLVLKKSAALRSQGKKFVVEQSSSYRFQKLFFIIRDWTTTFCNFFKSVVTKHVLKYIWGRSVSNKACIYRTATWLKRDLDIGVFLWPCIFFRTVFYRTTRLKFIYTTEFIFYFFFFSHFLVNFTNFSRKVFLQRKSRWLLLIFSNDIDEVFEFISKTSKKSS